MQLRTSKHNSANSQAHTNTNVRHVANGVRYVLLAPGKQRSFVATLVMKDVRPLQGLAEHHYRQRELKK